MKTVRHLKYFILFLLTLGLGLGSFVRAEEAKASEAPAAPAGPEKPEPAVEAAVASEDSSKEKDASAAATASEHDDDDDNDDGKTAVKQGATEKESKASPKPKKLRRHNNSGNERVSIFSDSTLEEGKRADAVISIVGSSTSAGEVGDAVVSVLGGSRVTGGTVGDAVVSVLGNTYVNGHVRGEVVTVLGDVEFGPNAVVEGEVVIVGGKMKRDPASVLKSDVQNIAIGGHSFSFEGITVWFQKCLMYGRPLAFDSRLMWAWGIALSFLAFYLLVAAVAPAGVAKGAETLEQRPGSCILAAVLGLLLTPVAYILLVFTIALGGLGIVLIPLFSLGLFIASVFGKIVMLTWIGRRVLKLTTGAPGHAALAVLIGGGIMLALYTIPVAGFITYKLLGILGLGTVIYTLILQMKSNRAARPAPAPRVVAAPVMSASGEMVPPAINPPLVSAAPAVISAATLPRAGFWIRLVASFLDCVLLGIVMGMSSKIFHGWFSPGGSLPFWFAVYCIIMWTTKGTTIGGIICGLKVVRLDDRPLDWGVAIVRALGGFLSLAVAGLGFIWVAFDDDKQSWHDKIAGTTIVKVPKGTSLM